MALLLRLLRALIVLAPRELVVALARAAVLLVNLLLVLLLWLWELLLAAIKGKGLFQEEHEEPCGRLPEAVIRRPDPAIYSQRLLLSQGLPVTWNNPDIWIAPAANPNAVEPDSYHLREDTDYIVTVRVHNAGTDPALGVRVRLVYRPWSFNSPEVTPVQTDTAGNEVARFVNVAPMGSADTTFAWHTPAIAPGQEAGHFCLEARLHHPMDVNTANNIGQENTNVLATPNPGPPAPGDVVDVDVPLHNHARREQAFRFTPVRYDIDPTDNVELRLQTIRGRARRTPMQAAANLAPTWHPGRRVAAGHTPPREPDGPGEGPAGVARDRRRGAAVRYRHERFTLTARPAVVAAKNRYVGFDRLREQILARDYSLPAGMTVQVAGQDPETPVPLPAGTTGAVRFSIKVPDDALPGSRVPVNLLAFGEDGVLIGGVTVIVDVGEA